MMRYFRWASLALVSIGLTVVFRMPATWLAEGVQQQSQGRLLLLDTQGTIWKGHATLALAFGGQTVEDALTLPGRLYWELSIPRLFSGQIQLKVRHTHAIRDGHGTLGGPIQIDGSLWSMTNKRSFQISDGELQIPAGWLVGFGAPFNSLKPKGHLRWHWDDLTLFLNNRFAWQGKSHLLIQEFSSTLSTIRPLGYYRVEFRPLSNGTTQLSIKTERGPLILEGSGKLGGATGFQYEGRAYASDSYKERLQGLINMLGRSQADGSAKMVF